MACTSTNCFYNLSSDQKLNEIYKQLCEVLAVVEILALPLENTIATVEDDTLEVPETAVYWNVYAAADNVTVGGEALEAGGSISGAGAVTVVADATGAAVVSYGVRPS